MKRGSSEKENRLAEKRNHKHRFCYAGTNNAFQHPLTDGLLRLLS